MSWFRVSGGSLRYRGRVTRQPFAEWAATPDGQSAIAAAGAQLGFCLFGRARTARRRMWRDLRSVAGSDAVRAVLAAEPDRYLAVWTEVAYAPALPRLSVSLRRVVVVPRTMIAARALSALSARLMRISDYAALDAPVRAFFAEHVIREMDAAIRRASPSPKRPVAAPERWACVAVDERFTWVDPLWSGRDWQGHVTMSEMPVERLSRRERRELAEAVDRLQRSLSELSVVQRDGTVRSAAAALQPVRV